MNKIDMTSLAFPKSGVFRDRKYLDWLREQPCAFSGATGQNEPAHIGVLGRGIKSSDYECLPLTHDLHMLQSGQVTSRKSGFLDALNSLPREMAELSLKELLKDAGAFRYIQYILGESTRYGTVMKVKKC